MVIQVDQVGLELLVRAELLVGQVPVAFLGGQEHPEHQAPLAPWQRLDILACQVCPVIVPRVILVGQVHPVYQVTRVHQAHQVGLAPVEYLGIQAH